MDSATPRRIEEQDLGWIHALNQQHAEELSDLTEDALRELISTTSYAKVVDHQAGFLLAMSHNSSYSGLNFAWFKQRYPRFVYIDRIAIASEARGRGIARTLYHDLFQEAERERHTLVACEVNQQPPNRPSEAFHLALGFKPIGEADLADQNKTVQYFIRELTNGE